LILKVEEETKRQRESPDFKIRKNSGAYRGPKIDTGTEKTLNSTVSAQSSPVHSNTDLAQDGLNSPKRFVDISKMRKMQNARRDWNEKHSA
jgi:hypothetical protein